MAYKDPGGQVAGLQGPRWSRGRPSVSQGVKGWATWSQGVKGVGLQGPRGSRGRLTRSQGVKEMATGSQVVKG